MVNINELYEVIEMYGNGINEEEEYCAFINIKTGEILTINHKIFKMAQEKKCRSGLSEWEDADYAMSVEVRDNPKQFEQCPNEGFVDEYQIMEKFCNMHKETLGDLNNCESQRVLKSRIYENDMQEQWYIYKDNVILQQLKEWCGKKGIVVVSSN